MITSLRHSRSFFPTVRAAMLAGLVLLPAGAFAQQQQTPSPMPAPPPVTTTSPDSPVQTTVSTGTDSTGKTTQSVNSTYTFKRGKKKKDEDGEKVVQSKDTKRAIAKARTADALIGVDSKLPDKQLYDKAVEATKKGHFDVARLDLQTMLNTYPDSQYQMRAKLAIADSWYKEGGTAALTQAESEYADFRVFFPNAPEAAEAQMRIGDIYFRQMDRPDRDYAKAMHAEEEYRRMLTDYPDSKLIPDAKQRLREVQELLASRESDIASFYGTRNNFGAQVARYQTVVDTYPLYSHMDDVLIGLGDAYAGEAKYIRGLSLAQAATAQQREQYEAGRAKLETIYDGLAADAYRKVVTEHAASPHMEDARDRLAAMNLPIPEPSKEQIAASEALENSRSSYRLTDRAKLIFLHAPDTVVAARIGEPTLTDPAATTAPTVVKRVNGDFAAAFAPPAARTAAPVATAPVTAPVAAAPVAPAVPAAPLAFQPIPTDDPATSAPTAVITTPSAATTTGGDGVGIEVLNNKPAASNGLRSVGPTNNTALPPVEKAADAPDVINDAAGAKTAPAQVAPANGKAAKPEFDKADESSSKHKPKKGIKKVIPPNPF